MNYLAEAITNLLNARLRSTLSLIGILVGTAAVVAMISAGLLASNAILAQFKTLGTNLMLVSLSSPANKSAQNFQTKKQITLKQKNIIKTAPFIQTYTNTFFHSKKLQSNILGVTASFADLMQIKINHGRLISTLDNQEMFCVIGDGIAKQIKAITLENPIGQYIQTKNMLLKIIGSLSITPESIFLPVDLNNTIFIPINTMAILNSTNDNNNIILQLAPNTNISSMEKWVKQQLKYVAPNQTAYIFSPKILIKKINNQSKILTVFLTTAGTITLIVGGIGVMNIMLVSVIERKREIGIRLALGAPAHSIRNLFLTEAILLSLCGGIPGIVLGVASSWLIAAYWQWPFAFFWLPPIIGFSVSSLTGLISGLYPAMKAAKLSPAEALRSD